MRWFNVFASLLLLGSLAQAADDKVATDKADQANEEDYNVVSPAELKDGFVNLFDGKTLRGWQGDVKGYKVEDGTIVCHGGNLFTAKEYNNFILRFEFKLTPAGNNGVGIRAPLKGDAAYAGMEIQILDGEHKKYKGWLQPYQHHGSIYGVVAAKRGFLKPTGEWNYEEIFAEGPHIRVTLNGTIITDADLSKITKTADHKEHPGLHNAKGYIGWLGHGDAIAFRHVRVKELPDPKKKKPDAKASNAKKPDTKQSDSKKPETK